MMFDTHHKRYVFYIFLSNLKEFDSFRSEMYNHFGMEYPGLLVACKGSYSRLIPI